MRRWAPQGRLAPPIPPVAPTDSHPWRGCSSTGTPTSGPATSPTWATGGKRWETTGGKRRGKRHKQTNEQTRKHAHQPCHHPTTHPGLRCAKPHTPPFFPSPTQSFTSGHPMLQCSSRNEFRKRTPNTRNKPDAQYCKTMNKGGPLRGATCMKAERASARTYVGGADEGGGGGENGAALRSSSCSMPRSDPSVMPVSSDGGTGGRGEGWQERAHRMTVMSRQFATLVSAHETSDFTDKTAQRTKIHASAKFTRTK